MTAHIPPSEAELEELQGKIDFVLRTHSMAPIATAELADELRAASEGC